MTPTALRDLLCELPWSTYTVGELNEINALAKGLMATVRNRHAEIRSAANQEAMARRTQTDGSQITREQVYPAGSRAD